MIEVIYGLILILGGLWLGKKILDEIFGARCERCHTLLEGRSYSWKHDPEPFCPTCDMYVEVEK